jgi:hypothetical protein
MIVNSSANFAECRTQHGWGVVRVKLWHFVGLFETEQEATEKAAELGPEYEVHQSHHRVGTDDFIW